MGCDVPSVPTVMPATFPRLIAGEVSSPLFTSSGLQEVEDGSALVAVSVVSRSSRAGEFDTTGVASESDAELVCPALVICDTASAVLGSCMTVVEGAGATGVGVTPLGDPAGIDGLAGCDSGGAGAVGVSNPGADSPAPGLPDSSSPPKSSSESESDMESPSSESKPSLSSDPESSSPSSSPDSESASSSFSSAIWRLLSLLRRARRSEKVLGWLDCVSRLARGGRCGGSLPHCGLHRRMGKRFQGITICATSQTVQV